MADLLDQYRILYLVYESFHKNEAMNFLTLQTKEDVRFIAPEKLRAELLYLIKNGYVDSGNS